MTHPLTQGQMRSPYRFYIFNTQQPTSIGDPLYNRSVSGFTVDASTSSEPLRLCKCASVEQVTVETKQ